MRKTIIIMICIIVTILLGIFFGIRLINSTGSQETTKDSLSTEPYQNNVIVRTIEISENEEKTTPNTLIIFKTYYTKCKHYIKKYENIDVTKVNLTEEEFKEKYKKWKLDKFTPEEIELSKEEEKFCGQHYKIKLEENNVVIYKIDENGREYKYEDTDITKEYLTIEDISKLRTGIIVYGNENLTSTIEDYE